MFSSLGLKEIVNYVRMIPLGIKPLVVGPDKYGIIKVRACSFLMVVCSMLVIILMYTIYSNSVIVN